MSGQLRTGTPIAQRGTMKRTPIFLALLGAIACSDAPDVEVANVGDVCAFASDPQSGVGGPQTFAADAPAHFRVTYDECLSACIRNELASCVVERNGAELTVSSHFSYDEADSSEACIALCYALEATCASPNLEAGTYEVKHGGQTHSFTVPATNVDPCF